MWPTGHGGPDRAPNRIPLCSNAHSAVHDYLTRLLRARPYLGPVDPAGLTIPVIPWLTRIRYGRKVRHVAETGFRAIHTRTVVKL